MLRLAGGGAVRSVAALVGDVVAAGLEDDYGVDAAALSVAAADVDDTVAPTGAGGGGGGGGDADAASGGVWALVAVAVGAAGVAGGLFVAWRRRRAAKPQFRDDADFEDGCAADDDDGDARAAEPPSPPPPSPPRRVAAALAKLLDRSPKAAPRVYVAARAPAAALRRASLDDDDDDGAPAPVPALDAAAVLGGLGAERFVDDLVDLGGGELLPRLADDCFVDDGGAVLAPRPADDAAVLVEDCLVDLDAGGPLLLAADDADRVGD